MILQVLVQTRRLIGKYWGYSILLKGHKQKLPNRIDLAVFVLL